MSDIAFDGHIGVGTVIEIVLLIVGLAGGWFTMKVMQKVLENQLSELKSDVEQDRKANGERHEANVDRMNKIELKIAEDCLKKDDFREFERRFDARVDKIEHAAANAATKAAGMIADVLRAQGRTRGAGGN